nr:hypothetical protein [Tanacetum cinerariifolium]
MYCLVVTDDFSRFSWVFFLATKDETSEILKTFITGIENLIDLKVKVIRRDNGIEFKNRVMNQFCEIKGIKREFSVVRTPKQNGVAEWKNRTLIEAARTMLVDLKLLTTFWAEAFNTACYVQNGADEGFFIGYPTNSKAFRVFNSRTRIVEENLHVKFSENTPNITGTGPNWLFDIDALTKSMNYNLVVARNQSNGSVGKARVVTVPDKDYIMLPLETQDPLFPSSFKDSPGAGYKSSREEEKKDAEDLGNKDNEFSDAGNGDLGADVNNFDTNFQVSPVPTTRIHKDHPLEQVIGDLHSAPQTKRMSKNLEEHGLQVKQKEDGIFISQDKYVNGILNKFGYSDVKTASTPMKTHKTLLKDEKEKMIFRYLIDQPKLGLWYPKDSPFDLVAYTNSDYAGASLDRKSTTGGCQFLGCKLISWQCRKQTVVANSTIEAEYI